MKCKRSKPRVLTFLDLTGLGLGNSLGVGVFVLLGELTRKAAGPAVVISIALSGLTAILMSLCHAEFGTRFVKADTAYSYSHLYHGENVAFVLGWALMLEFIAGAASVAKGIITFIDALTEYEISNFLKSIASLKPDLGFPYVDFFSPFIILFAMIFVICGLKESTFCRKILTSGTIVLLFSIIIAGSFKADLTNWDVDHKNSSFEKNFIPFGYLGVLKGAAISFYGYIGLDTMSVTGKEMKNPQICVPFANLISACIIMVLYAGVAVVLTLMVPHTEHVLGAALPFAFEKVKLVAFKWIIAAGAFLGFSTSLLGVTIPISRVINSMANDGLFCRCLGNGYLSGKAPVKAVIVGGILSAVCAGIVNFEILTKLTVIATLFSSTVLAIDIIMLRYVPQTESTRNISDGAIVSTAPRAKASLFEVLRLFFRFTTSTPSKLTEKFVKINLILFCIASLGLAIIFTVFNDFLMEVAIEVIAPSVLLLAIMLINLVSITFQPKTNVTAPFKVPMIPFVPCLSIFLNLVLMTLLGSLTLIYFAVWMATGIIPYFFWFSIKYLKGDIGGNSLYEINKLNSIKLNESVWKITSDKKSFYEGAINPVFQDDEGEETFDEHEKRKKQSFSEEDDTKPTVKKDVREGFNEINRTVETTEEEVEKPKEKSDKNCVADVHMGEDNLEESYEFQMVDTTYDFLSDMAEDFTKDEITAQKSENSSTSSKADVFEQCNDTRNLKDSVKDTLETTETSPKSLSESSIRKNNIKRHSSPMKIKKGSHQRINSEGKIKIEKIARKPRRKTSSESGLSRKEENEGRAKAFKDKLNLLLKNQMNMNDIFKESISKYEKDSEEAWMSLNGEGKPEFIARNIKTLNKSQMRDTLEILLAKGPPKRYSLRNSFNIRTNETSTKSENPNKVSESTKQ